MWRQSDTLVKKSELGEIRTFSSSKSNSCCRTWTWLIGVDTLQDSERIEVKEELFCYESRLNKHGATEQHFGTVGDKITVMHQ